MTSTYLNNDSSLKVSLPHNTNFTASSYLWRTKKCLIFDKTSGNSMSLNIS